MMTKTPGIYEDSVGGIYYGHESEFSNSMRFFVALVDFHLVNEDRELAESVDLAKIQQVYARWCVANCEWHEPGGYWHIEHEPGRGRTKAWQYGTV